MWMCVDVCECVWMCRCVDGCGGGVPVDAQSVSVYVRDSCVCVGGGSREVYALHVAAAI